MIVGKKGVAGLSKARPMFAQFVLEPLWQVYQAALEDGDNNKVMLEKVIKSFNLNVPPRELQNKDPKVVLQAVMSRWLPLFDAVLSMVRQVLSDGVDPNALAEAELVRKSVEACDSRPEAPCVAFVSKMFAVPMKVLPQRGLHVEIINNVSDEGESMKKHIQEAELQSLYLMMGQGLTHVASAHAGNLVAIRGLGQHILKSATLSSTKNCWPFSCMAFQVSPTLRVAIEPSYPADLGALTKGLWLLNRADPFVEVTVSARGEHVLSATGEVHLERCIKDLKERFARIDLEVCPPLVSYKETIEGDVVDKLKNLKLFLKSSDCVKKKTPNERCTIKVRVIKLPPSLTKVLEENSGLLGEIIEGNAQTDKNLDTKISRIEEDENPTEALTKRFMDAVESDIYIFKFCLVHDLVGD
ncbi:elongation factor-like GTPase 1 [Prunus yedoensis var. nudiflora]|uniref:Elongation factor-like GTPase 1 n=1 Tax=Prunus yedoensis var. nudiflora TaxID=2094558 RepID=A0A314Y9I6_PRUYE|nr:elongation factor-like GTPase 1 [Prunus yedoensis var. nudiflora]